MALSIGDGFTDDFTHRSKSTANKSLDYAKHSLNGSGSPEKDLAP